MSGGYFGGSLQFKIDYAADDLKSYIDRCESGEKDEDGYDAPSYTAETLKKLRECERALRQASAMLRRVDYLVSNDDSEESFHAKWTKEVSSE